MTISLQATSATKTINNLTSATDIVGTTSLSLVFFSSTSGGGSTTTIANYSMVWTAGYGTDFSSTYSNSFKLNGTNGLLKLILTTASGSHSSSFTNPSLNGGVVTLTQTYNFTQGEKQSSWYVLGSASIPTGTPFSIVGDGCSASGVKIASPNKLYLTVNGGHTPYNMYINTGSSHFAYQNTSSSTFSSTFIPTTGGISTSFCPYAYYTISGESSTVNRSVPFGSDDTLVQTEQHFCHTCTHNCHNCGVVHNCHSCHGDHSEHSCARGVELCGRAYHICSTCHSCTGTVHDDHDCGTKHTCCAGTNSIVYSCHFCHNCTYSATVHTCYPAYTIQEDASKLTISVAKLALNSVPSGTVHASIGEVDAINWVLNVSNEVVSGKDFTYYIMYNTVSGSAYKSVPISTTVSTTASYKLTTDSSPINTSEATTYYVKFYVVDGYGNYATTSLTTVIIKNALSVNLQVTGVGIAVSTTSTTAPYYTSPTQNPVFMLFPKLSTTGDTTLNLSANWYSSTELGFSPTGSNTQVIVMNSSLLLFKELSTFGGYAIGNTFYVMGILQNNVNGTLSSTLSNQVGLYIVPPLSVSLAPLQVNVTSSKGGTTRFTASASGGGKSGVSYSYTWYYDDNEIKSLNSPNFSTTFSPNATTGVHTVFVEVKSNQTLETLTSNLAVINVVGSLNVSLDVGGNSLVGLVDNVYIVSAVASGGVPPYTYHWAQKTPSGSTDISYGGANLRFSYGDAVSGDIYVLVNDTNNASASASVAFTMYSYMNPSLSASVAKYVATLSTTVSGSGYYQQYISISNYSNYGINSDASNFEFTTSGGTTLYSWVEAIGTSTTTVWVKIPYGTKTLNLMVYDATDNVLSSSGYAGKAPQLSTTYGEYDNGANVFLNYFSGATSSGWTIAGTAGQTTSAPSGSPFGANAFYALNSIGSYLYTIANGQSTNMIIEYYTYINRLNDVFFLVNSTGAGQLARQGNGGGWYGIATTSTWTSWSAPPDTGSWTGWVMVGVVVNNGVATEYLSPTLGNYGSEIGSNPSNQYTVTNKGNYLGLVGDGGGSSTEYWNGLIVRIYVPEMPSVSLITTPNNYVGGITSFTVSYDADSGTTEASYVFTYYVNGLNKGGSGATFNFSTTVSGEYGVWCTMYDKLTGLSQTTNTITVTYYGHAIVEAYVNRSSTQIGLPINFSAYASYGIPPYEYTWFYNTANATTDSVLLATTQDYTYMPTYATTLYFFAKVSDENETIATNLLRVKIKSPLSVILSITPYNVVSQPITLSAIVFKGSKDFQYTWYLPTTTYVTSTATTVYQTSVLSKGSYTASVTVKDLVFGVSSTAINGFNVVGSPSSASGTFNLTARISSTLITTSAPASTYSFTVLVGGVNVQAYNIDAIRTIDVAGQMTFNTIKKYVVPINGIQVINVGSPVKFYFQNILVWTGVVENIEKKSTMEYKITCYDAIYYLANLRVQYSTSNLMDLGNLMVQVLRYSDVNYDAKTTGIYVAPFFDTNDPVYYDIVKLAAIYNYKTYLDTTNTLHLIPNFVDSTTNITENVNFMAISKTNDVNYYFNNVSVKAQLGIPPIVSATNISPEYATYSLATTYATNSTTVSANATQTAKAIDFSTFGVVGTTSFTNLASTALKLFPNGYRYVKTWYQFATDQNYDLLSVGNQSRFNITFRDGTVWTDMMMYEVEINQTGVYLYFANFLKDIWSQLNSITLLTS
jgi:hypothetical protein